ncbi:MAG: hypothetical protein ACLQQ4_07745 [Bacteroidia bacterium]
MQVNPVNPITMQSINILPTANAVTTQPLTGIGTGYNYNPGSVGIGTSGIGAQIIGKSNAAITSAYLDGVTPVVGMIILVNDEAFANWAYHGLYVLTAIGSGTAPFVLTRHPNQSAALDFCGSIVPVDNTAIIGTGTYPDTLWISIGSISGFVVGVTPVLFKQVSSPGGSNYNTVEVVGSTPYPLYARPALNFSNYFVGADDPGNNSTDITIGNALLQAIIASQRFFTNN